METYEATLDRIIFEAPDNDYKVLRLRDDNGKPFTAVGDLPQLTDGQELSIKGYWTQHEKFGKQFRIKQAEMHQPTSEEGIQKYLASSLVSGIGPEIAERITDKFGEDTLEIMDEEIERLEEVSGIGSSKLESIKEDWEEQKHMQDVMLFLKEHDVSTAYARKIYDQYDDDAVAVLKENPYRLCRDVEGIAFKIADKIAKKLGMEQSSSARLEAGLEHVLVEASEEGHVYLPEEELLEESRDILGVEVDSIERPLAKLEEQNRIVREENGETVVYLKPLYDAEERVAENLHELSNVQEGFKTTPPDDETLKETVQTIQQEQDFEYNEKQMEAIRASVQDRVVILTGGPGTGKTTTVTGMIQLMEELEWTIKLAAPTGRAAQRLEEATDHEASTIHRLLDYQPPSTYGKNENDQLDTDIVIVDEMSMVDLWLMDRLLRAIQNGTRIVFVGDADQLPSVGPGDILNDLIESGHHSVIRLREIFRQARQSRIISNAHRINEGKMPELSNDEEGDFFYIEESDPIHARGTVINLVNNRLPGYYGFDPFEDIQVVAPMYQGDCGVDALNEHLQDRINPGRSEDSFGPQEFREGDRVMQLENNYEKYVFNGDVGRVRSIDWDDDEMTVNFPGSNSITYEKASLNQIALAYAITIHKSQGSEFPAVIIPLLTQHYIMLQRNLIYTALTRAKELAVIVGTKKSIGMAVNNAKDRERNTSLPGRLRTITEEQ